MYSPRARTGRKPGGVKPIAAALAVALMGMGGVALAAPKSDPGPPEQAQANGPAPQAQANEPAPQAQANGPAPQAQNPAPPPQAKAKGHQRAGTPVDPPPAQPPQGGGEGNPGAGQNGNGRPAPGETRGRGESRSTRAKSGACRFAGCRHGGPKPDAGASGGGAEQPQPAGGQPAPPAGGDAPGESGERPGKDQRGSHGGGAFGDQQVGVPELGSVLGANQGGGEEVETTSGSFDSALPFTGFEVLLLAGIGALLWLMGVRLRRATA
jgi:translation initiation factor IF-2